MLQRVAVCSSVLQCVVARCTGLQSVAVCCTASTGLCDLSSVHANDPRPRCAYMTDSVAVCCSVLQWGAVWCSVVQCVAVCCSEVQCVVVRCSVVQCVAVFCSVLPCGAVYCSARCRLKCLRLTNQMRPSFAEKPRTQRPATHCNTLQQISSLWNTLQSTTTQ